MNLPKVTNQGVAVFCIASAEAGTFWAFFLSRSDHDLKLMSLQAVLTLGGTLLGIAGTLLVGTTAYKAITGADLPPGTKAKLTESSEVSLNPTVPADPAQPK